MDLLLIGFLSIIIFGLFSIAIRYVSPNKKIYLFELGYFYPITIVLSILLSVVPLWVTESLGISPLDNRFFKDYFDYKDAEAVGLMYLLYLVAFCTAYTFFRKGVNSCRNISINSIEVSIKGTLFVVSIYVLFEVYLITIRLLYHVEAESYADTYIMYKGLPLILQQITGVVIGTMYIIKILLLIVLFQKYRQYKIIIWGFVGYQFLETLLVLGERSNLVILITTFLILYHTTVKPISLKTMLIVGVFGIVFITALGELRNTKGDVSALIEDSNGTPNGGEFESVFLNSVDLYQRKGKEKVNVPISLYFSGLVSLIPQQLLPFEKTTYADWYVGTYYPDFQERGNGFAFGVVAESIVGFGVVQLIFHAFILAYLFAKFHRIYLKENLSIQFCCFYVWLTLFSYYCFRFNTFYLVPLIVYRFFPTNLLFGLINSKVKTIS